MNNLHKTPFAKQRTADDNYYKSNLHKNFYDLRWMMSTNADALNDLKHDEIVNKILHSCGTSFSRIDSEITRRSKYSNEPGM